MKEIIEVGGQVNSMKKRIIIVWIAAVFLFILSSCSTESDHNENSSKELQTESALQPTEPSMEVETEEEKGTALIFNETTKTGFNVNVETEGVVNTQNGDLLSSGLFINKKKYYFPFIVNCFANDEWLIDGQIAEDAIYRVLSESKYENLILSDGKNAKLQINAAFFGVDTSGFSAELVLSDITIKNTSSDNSFWILPGGITSKSTAKNVIDIYGDPNKTKSFSSSSYNTDRELYYLEHETTGISYCFKFHEDGSIDSVRVYMSDENINKPLIYSNKYFSVEMPGFWRGRVHVEEIKDRTYEFKFNEGGKLFTLYLLNENEPFDNFYCNMVIGKFKGKGETLELVFLHPTDEQAPEGFEAEFHTIIDNMSLQFFVERIQPENGYSFSLENYEDYIGTYTVVTGEHAGFELTVQDAYYSQINFKYGFYSRMRTNEIEDGYAIISHGKGEFEAEDGWGYPCEGYIRLADGKAYVSITAEEQENGHSTLATDGELVLEKYVPDGAAAEYSGGSAKDIAIGPDVTKYLGWYITDLENTFGKDYEIDEYDYLSYGTDILFELEWGSHGIVSEQYVSGVCVYGHYNLGNGIFSDMRIDEIASVFGGSGGPWPSGDGYSLGVVKNGFTYTFHWNGDYHAKSEYVFIYET